MEHASAPHAVQAARLALISGRKWVPGKKEGALYNNDHLLLTLFELAPGRVSYRSNSLLYLFNAWRSTIPQILEAVASVLLQNERCGKGLQDHEAAMSCAMHTVSTHVMAIHHLGIQDHLRMLEQQAAMRKQGTRPFEAGICTCTMKELFGKMLPYFMRYGASPWNANLQEWGQWHLQQMLPCGM